MSNATEEKKIKRNRRFEILTYKKRPPLKRSDENAKIGLLTDGVCGC